MGISGRLEVKVACWSTKATISLKRVKVEENYYGGPIGTHQRSFERYNPRPPMASCSSRLGVRNPYPKPKTLIAIISGTGVAIYGLQIWQVHSEGLSEQRHIKNLEKRERGRIIPGTACDCTVPAQ